MKAEAWIAELSGRLQSPCYPQEPMSRHTSWKVGGAAQLLVDLAAVEDLKTILSFAQERQIKWQVLGLGTNLLVADQGLEGISIKIGGGLAGVELEGDYLRAKAGTTIGQLVKKAKEAGLGGLEFLAGIPGTVGGAVAMNAGAWKRSISELVQKVLCLNPQGQFEELEPEQLNFAYRNSRILNSGLIALEVVFLGTKKEPALIGEQMKRYLDKRKSLQPLEYPNAGSVFKNPPADYAGRLIEQSGCKGLRVGGAEVSQKHANFIINRQAATAGDIRNLIELVQQKVEQEFGVSLEVEVQFSGNRD